MQDRKVNNPVLDIRDLVVHYNTNKGVVKAVNGINLQLAKRRSIGLVGETGAGNTAGSSVKN